MKSKLLNSIKPLSLSIALSLSSFSVQHILAAEFTAPQALFPDYIGSIAPQLYFAEEESSDIYIAIRVNGEGDLYFISEEKGFTTEALPYTTIDSFTGLLDLPKYDTSGFPTLQAQFFHISVNTGESIFDINNWIGGVESLSILNFSVGQARDIDGDWNNDGWSDDDLNKNGYHDGDEVPIVIEPPVVITPVVETPVVVTPPPAVNTVIRGKSTYDFACAACHGSNPLGNRDGIINASVASRTQSAIITNQGGMAALSFLTPTDLQDIADYINSLL